MDDVIENPDIFKAGHKDKYVEYCNLLKNNYFTSPIGIHGMLHTKRVLIMSIILADLVKLDVTDTNILLTASVYHDIGRTGDGVCYQHGLRSWEKIVDRNLFYISKNEDTEILKYIIQNHCINDTDGVKILNNYEIKNRQRALMLLKVFKDADALDRVRLGDLNTDYLRMDVSCNLKNIAQRLLDLGNEIEKIFE